MLNSLGSCQHSQRLFFWHCCLCSKERKKLVELLTADSRGPEALKRRYRTCKALTSSHRCRARPALSFRSHLVVHRNKRCSCTTGTSRPSRHSAAWQSQKMLQGADGWMLFFLPWWLSSENSSGSCNRSDLWLDSQLTAQHPSEDNKKKKNHVHTYVQITLGIYIIK